MGCMMNYESKFAKIEKRLNLQSICKYIKHGSIINEIDKRSFIERAETAYCQLEEYIKNTCGQHGTEDILENITIYSSIMEDIHFSLGVKAGAQITIQLTNNLETDF